MQEQQLHEEEEKAALQLPPHEEYTTHINELISEPADENVATKTAQYILSSLYQLSSYLLNKQLQGKEASEDTHNLQLSFNSYLELMGEDLGKFSKSKSIKALQTRKDAINMEAQLLKCYDRVDGIYFEENYVLDLSYFETFYGELKSRRRKDSHPGVERGESKQEDRVDGQMNMLCECLDIVEINLFSQIHCKFQEYFRAVANFQYLKESVALHLRKLQASRQSIGRVKRGFLDKSVSLRRKIVQRQNIEKLLTAIKQIRSIKKIPQVLESILASSLPYESLSLLQDTKATLKVLGRLHCLRNTSESLRSMDVLVQNDLTKRYANELYLYLEECHSPEQVSLEQLWSKIEVHTCLDKDSSFVLDQLNSSTSSALSDNPQSAEEIQLLEGTELGTGGATVVPRNEGKEYQIAMILLQSYKYVEFSPEVTKIKVCNALRLFVKRFERELLLYLNKVVDSEILSIKGKEPQDKPQDKLQDEEGSQEKEEHLKGGDGDAREEAEEAMSGEVVEKVSVEFYIKHLGLLNEIFRDTINRFLGYLNTLLTEYEEELGSCEDSAEAIASSHDRFRAIFEEECSLLPSIFKIIEEKIKYLLTLKNISSIDALSFFRWITALRYWQRYLDDLVEHNPLFSHQPTGSAQPYLSALVRVVEDNLRRAVQVMNLQTLLLDLTRDYIEVFHKNTSNNEIVNTLQEDTWQSTEIPPQFSQILHNIFNPEGTVLNSSVTILDSSTSSLGLNTSSSSSKGREGSLNVSRSEEAAKTKIKLLKNNIQMGGVRYKVNLSFLILCEWVSEYTKVGRILSQIFDREAYPAHHQQVLSLVYEKTFELMELFAVKGKELILDFKAVAFGKIKSKTINAKHICLLSNCLSVVTKIAQDMLLPEKLDKMGLREKQQKTLSLLDSTRQQVVTKLSAILSFKTDSQITEFLKGEGSKGGLSTKTSNSLVGLFLQMVEITDEYLVVEEVRQVLKAAFQSLTQKYLTHLLLKGGKQTAEVEILIEKLKFLKKYFPEEYDSLLQEIPH